MPFPREDVTPPVTKIYLAVVDIDLKRRKKSGAKVGVSVQTTRDYSEGFPESRGEFNGCSGSLPDCRWSQSAICQNLLHLLFVCAVDVGWIV